MTTPSEFDITITDELESVRGSQQVLAPFDWFSRLWGIAVVAHVVGNPRVGQAFGEPTALGWVTLVTGLLAVAVVIRPTNRVALQAMSVGVLATVWLEAPFIGNHWLLAGLISVALLVALSGSDSWNLFSATGRGIHLAFYAFAAFAKLNASFFDSSVSCAVFYTNETLQSWGFPPAGVSSVLASLSIWTVVVVELAIPVMLLVRRWRHVGVAVGLVFHVLISLNLDQHFYDFTAVLIPLFLLWARPALPESLGQPLSRNAELMLSAILGFFVVLSLMPEGRVGIAIITDGIFIVWVPAAVALVSFVIPRLGVPADVRFVPPNAVAWLLVGIALFNGLTPYTELKTATSWNMYSNLLTAGGESNHFIIRSTVPLSNGQLDPVTVLETGDPGLAEYVGTGYSLPERTFLDYLADNPGVAATVEQNGLRKEVTSADGAALNPLLERFGLLRAIDTQSKTRCQIGWLPAR